MKPTRRYQLSGITDKCDICFSFSFSSPKGRGEGAINWEIGIKIHTLLDIKYIITGPTVQHRELYSILYDNVYKKRTLKRYMHMYN